MSYWRFIPRNWVSFTTMVWVSSFWSWVMHSWVYSFMEEAIRISSTYTRQHLVYSLLLLVLMKSTWSWIWFANFIWALWVHPIDVGATCVEIVLVYREAWSACILGESHGHTFRVVSLRWLHPFLHIERHSLHQVAWDFTLTISRQQ